MRWSKRHLPFFLFLGLACTLAIASAADTVSDAFSKYFGKLAEDNAAKQTLVSHLDTLLKLGAKRPGEGLRFVHDYEDDKAKTLGVEVVPTLMVGSVDAWADRVLELLRGMDEGQTYSLLRRVITAALLKLWLEGGQKLPDGSADKIKEVMLKVGLQRRRRVPLMSRARPPPCLWSARHARANSLLPHPRSCTPCTGWGAYRRA